MIWIILLFVIIGTAQGIANEGFVGCYRDKDKPGKSLDLSRTYGVNECREECQKLYYRYAMIRNGNRCYCGNFLGTKYNTGSCEDVCPNCSYKAIITDVYFTGVEVPGPPKGFLIRNITDTTAFVSWKEPESYVDIQNYEIQFKILHTYSTINIMTPTLLFSNNTFDTELNFQPGTKYNVTLQAVSKRGKGVATFQIVESLIGFPDNIPSTPVILNREDKIMIVQLSPVINNNGPISAYRIAVINEDMNQILQIENLKSYRDAMTEGFGYYITGEIRPQDMYKNFTIGDGKFYGSYFNAPLEYNTKYRALLGVVSILNDVTKVAYSNFTETMDDIVTVSILPAPEPEDDTPGVIIGLSVAIGLLSFLLVAGIIGFFILTRRLSNRRRRLTDNQELTMQGPIIEVENSGYIPEEELIPKNHYNNLKQQVWSIPQTLIKIEPTNLLGIGKFGRVNSGTVRKDDKIIQVAVYTILDRKLGPENKRVMLKELDLLIRSGKNDNVLNLVGTCESQDTLFVVLEYTSMNLKDLLLGSRDALPGRFSNMQESHALDIAIGVTSGMRHLESLKIVHKQLCARNVLLTNGFIPKICGYGLAQYCNRNMVPDYTRWTATEVFQLHHYVSKCDVWSFACVLWEICSLGGTPYDSVPNNEIQDRVTRGLRLIQLRYISDDLYQVMLNCWQLDLDERPTFRDLVNTLASMKEDGPNLHLNFNLYPEFQYEQFYPNMELAARTIY